MDVKTFLKKYELEHSDKDEDRDTSLRGQALERALKLKRPNAGTPFDWQDWQSLTGNGTEDED